MSSFGGEELSGKVARVVGLFVGVAPLAGETIFELCVRREEALMVRWAAEGVFAASLAEENRG